MTNIKPIKHFPFSTEVLRDYLSEHLTVTDVTLTPIVGGLSNPSYFVDLGDQRVVLRKQPEGPLLPSAHAIDREYRVMQALYGSNVPVPKMLHYCENAEVIGTPFYVMECLEGRMFHNNSLPGMTQAERTEIFEEMNRVLVALHDIDPKDVGLENYGRPDGFLTRQVTRWSKQYHASATREIVEIDELASWLKDNIPEQDGATIVHGDYRLGNLMFHPTKPEIIGVLDWELSTLGDPLSDLGYNLLPWTMKENEYHGLSGRNLTELGIPERQAYADLYMNKRNFSGPYNSFYTAFSFFRLAVIFEGVVARAKAAGQKPPSDPAVGDISPLGQVFARHGLSLTGE